MTRHACLRCGAAVELSPVTRRWYVPGAGSPHWCVVVERAPLHFLECVCGAHVQRDEAGHKWDLDGEPHVCGVGFAAAVTTVARYAGKEGHSPTPERVQKAAAPGSSGADPSTVRAAPPRRAGRGPVEVDL